MAMPEGEHFDDLHKLISSARRILATMKGIMVKEPSNAATALIPEFESTLDAMPAMLAAAVQAAEVQVATVREYVATLRGALVFEEQALEHAIASRTALMKRVGELLILDGVLAPAGADLEAALADLGAHQTSAKALLLATAIAIDNKSADAATIAALTEAEPSTGDGGVVSHTGQDTGEGVQRRLGIHQVVTPAIAVVTELPGTGASEEQGVVSVASSGSLPEELRVIEIALFGIGKDLATVEAGISLALSADPAVVDVVIPRARAGVEAVLTRLLIHVPIAMAMWRNASLDLVTGSTSGNATAPISNTADAPGDNQRNGPAQDTPVTAVKPADTPPE